jgi:beta-glucuronidase
MLTQEEVPSWGGKTMQGDTTEAQITNTMEMINAHYNHPSIYAWGLCNEIGEKNASFAFVQKGRELALAMDPYRIHTQASNGLQAGDIVNTAQSYASSLVEFIEWNDYWESWYGGDLESLKANLFRIQEAFPDKSLVISEYGLCECNPKNPSGDERRIEILKTHTDIYRQFPNVAGAIFFDYNDYRTHIGDKGQGAFQQRVHGVVDLFGNRKPSWAVLRKESSPIKTLQLAHPTVTAETTSMDCAILTRSLENDLPAYSLREYTLTWIAYNQLGQPMGTGKTTLPSLSPGSHHTERLTWPTFENLDKVRVEIFRPTGYSVEDLEWVKP